MFLPKFFCTLFSEVCSLVCLITDENGIDDLQDDLDGIWGQMAKLELLNKNRFQMKSFHTFLYQEKIPNDSFLEENIKLTFYKNDKLFHN